MKIKAGFVLEKVGGSYLAVAVGKGAEKFSGLIRMNETGAFLWGLVEKRDMSAEELTEALMNEYEGAPREAVERDVASFEKKLRDGGILE